MAFEQLSLSPAGQPVDAPAQPETTSSAVAVNDRQSTNLLDVIPDDAAKVPRLPRWTRQEILVLIQGKKVAENRVRRGGRTGGLAFGSSGQVEPKWASVSSYCKRHGVNRGPVQCRKRWSNLAGDFKKIKEWESSIKKEDHQTESFWVMRNDLRRERKLPGFFDREVYDILDGGGGDNGGGGGGEEEEEGGLALGLGVGPVFDSGRSAAADDGLFSDFEQSGLGDQEEGGVGVGVGVGFERRSPDDKGKETPVVVVPVAPTPISEQQYQTFSQEHPPGQGTSYEKQPTLDPETGRNQEGKKRKRNTVEEVEKEDETRNLKDQLVEALERNGSLLSSQLESQNIHLQLEREQRKDHVNSLISVLNKLADALGRIADKL